MALANRWVTTRQLGLLLGFMGQRVLGQYDLALLTAEATPGKLLFVEENIRADGARPRRPARRRSGPGSRSTRRPTPSSSRRIRGCGRTSPLASSGSCTLFSRDAATLGREAMRAWGGRCAARPTRRALDGAAHERRAAAPVPRDPGGDEPARGLQRLRHGRGRPGARARASSGSRRDSTSGAERRAPFERAMLRLTGMDLKMEQYRQGRAVRARRSPRRRAGGAAPALGRARDAADATRRSRSPERWIARRAWRDRATDGPTVTTRRSTAAGPGTAARRGAPTAIALTPDPVGALPIRDLERDPGRGARRADRDRVASRAWPTVRSTTSRCCSAGWLSAEAFDRLLARAPRLSWVHSATAGVERALTPSARERGDRRSRMRAACSRARSPSTC